MYQEAVMMIPKSDPGIGTHFSYDRMSRAERIYGASGLSTALDFKIKKVPVHPDPKFPDLHGLCPSIPETAKYSLSFKICGLSNEFYPIKQYDRYRAPLSTKELSANSGEDLVHLVSLTA